MLLLDRFPGEAIVVGRGLVLRILSYTRCGVEACLEFDGKRHTFRRPVGHHDIPLTQEVSVTFYKVLASGCLRIGIAAPPDVRILRCELPPHDDRGAA